MIKDGLGIVVNFYVSSSNEDTQGLVMSTTELGLRQLKLNQDVDDVLLVDGSPEPCVPMQSICEKIGVLYHHHGRRLTYVEAYNIGWRMLPYRYIGLMANDIIPHPNDTVSKLLDWLKKPDVGCTFPYMNTSRRGWDEVQRPGFTDRGTLTCEPSSMTLNLNLFKRTILEEIGGLDENYLYGFQEPILILNIRNLGYRVVLVGNTQIFHFDALTKILGESSLTYDDAVSDANRWLKEYEPYASPRGLAFIKTWVWPFATTRSLKMAWWFVGAIPFQGLRFRLLEGLLWVEPWLCRYPTRLRK